MKRRRRDVSSLTLKRLALQTAQGDRASADVLGDAMQERGIEKIATGRVRLAPFYVNTRLTRPMPMGVLTIEESSRIIDIQNEASRLRSRGHRGLGPARVPAREVLYNTTWQNMFVMWITANRDVFRVLRAKKILPASVRFHEIVWETLPLEDLAWNLYVERTPRRRKRPQRSYVFSVYRDTDDPRTSEYQLRERFPLTRRSSS